MTLVVSGEPRTFPASRAVSAAPSAASPAASRTEQKAIFIASPEGFRQQNAGRRPEMLVKELIQNAFDESPTQLKVDVSYENDKLLLVVEDNVAGGFRDPDLIFTLWLSDKQDSPKKRGRMGRGLKEVISIADHAIISTEKHGIEFIRTPQGSSATWERVDRADLRSSVGTKVSVEISLWKKSALKGILEFLHTTRAPEKMTFIVNGKRQFRSPAAETYEMTLPSVVYVTERSERKERERRSAATVELIPAAESWIYEMGIPIEKIAFPFSLDIGQRVPLRDRRDTITDSYRRELFAQLLSKRVDKIPEDMLHDEWVHIGAQRADLLSLEVKQKVAHAYTHGAAFATNKSVLQAATGYHVPTAELRSFPEALRGIIREVGTDARTIVSGLVAATLHPIDAAKHTADQRKTVALFEEIAAGIERPCKVQLFSGRPDASASFNRDTQTLNLYPEVLGSDFFKKRFSAETVHILIHELAHWEPYDNAHGIDFKMDGEKVGAAIVAYVWTHPDLYRTYA